jgi:opacity protein-like surface antigen
MFKTGMSQNTQPTASLVLRGLKHDPGGRSYAAASSRGSLCVIKRWVRAFVISFALLIGSEFTPPNGKPASAQSIGSALADWRQLDDLDPDMTLCLGGTELYEAADFIAFPKPSHDTTSIAASSKKRPLPSQNRRLYLTGTIGADLASLSNSGSFEYVPDNFIGAGGDLDETILTGGAAIGWLLPGPRGSLRIELEGRARGGFDGETTLIDAGPGFDLTLPMNTELSNGWSVLTNCWLDRPLNERFGVYGGGGFGAGGYRYTTFGGDDALPVFGSSDVGTFAWQLGFGLTCRTSERVRWDLGYRYFAYGEGKTPLVSSLSGNDEPPLIYLGPAKSSVHSNELLLSVSIFDPFRWLDRR